MKGRKKTPTGLNNIRGNPGKRAQNKGEPQAPGARSLRVPRGRLGKDAARLWKDLAPLLDRLGVLKETDLAALELLCNHYGFAVEAAAEMRNRGILYEYPAAFDDDGNVTDWILKKNPANQVFRENAQAFRMMAAEFGLTPSSRARLDVDSPQELETIFDQFERMVNNSD